jgi:hypothetical protein
MKSRSVLLRPCLLLAGCLAFAAVAAAQVSIDSVLPLPAATPPPRTGLIGSDYLFLDAARVDQKSGGGSTTGAMLGVNFAPTEVADLTLNLAWVRQSDWPDNGNLYQLGVDVTPHLNLGRAKPFLVGGAGYQLSRTPSGADLGLWDLGGGVEFMVAARTAVTVKAVNVGSFSKGVSNPWQYTASVNHWLNEKLAVNASVTFIEDQATGYTLGVRWGF